MRIISGKARGTKLYTLDGYDTTRPTLDRVKEALFSKILSNIQDGVVLDLFAGSGALGLESLSRGAKKAYLCDSSFKAIKIINENIKKTHFENDTIVISKDYNSALMELNDKKIYFDIIFLDPPYNTDFAIKATDYIINNNMLNQDGIIVIETDNEEKTIKDFDFLKQDEFIVSDVKKYGKVYLIFLRRKG